MRSIFPELKFIDENGCFQQLVHIKEEFDEVMEAYYNEPISNFAEEVGDLATATMTLLYIIEDRMGIKAEDILERVRNKNKERDYGRKTEREQMP